MFRNILRATSFLSTKFVLRVCKFFIAGSTAIVNPNTPVINNKHDKFEEEIKRATKQGENYLAELMCMLRTLILQTSIEYQQCLINQIEITKQNTKIGPVGEHWDKLTGVRIRGNELKDELNRYEALATNIADIVQSEASSIFFGNDIVLDKLNAELHKLQKLCTQQLQEIHKYERQLLKVNCDSILHGKL